MATATTATGLDTSLADSLRQALRRLRGRATVGDVMASTGLAQADAESGLKKLLETYQGHVEVGEQGDIVYAFQRRLLRRDHTPLWVRLRSNAARVLKTAFKVWIVVMLVVYFVVFVTLLIAALIAASRGNDRNGGSILGGGRHRGGGFNFPFLFWIWAPDWRLGQPYYGNRFERRSGKKVPFYKKVFAFVFGPDRPRPSLRDRDRGAIRLIRARKGTLTVPELVRHTGLPIPEAEEEMGRLMGAYGGDVHVSREGELVYSFADLLVSAHGRVKVREPAPAWQRLEKAADFTGNKTGTNVLVGSLNGFNLLAALTAPVLIFPPLGLGGLGAEIGLIWVPAVFSTLFFAVPLGRWFGHRAENARRRLRNVRKVLLGMVFRQSLGSAAPLSAERATDDVRIALVDPDIGAADVRNQLQKMSAEFDAEVEPADSGQITYCFPAIRSALLGGEEVRSALRLDKRRVGRVVYSSGDTPEEESARALANFDRELRRSVSASDKVRYLDDFELAGIDAPSPTGHRVKPGRPARPKRSRRW